MEGVLLQTVIDEDNGELGKSGQEVRLTQRSVSSGVRAALHRLSLWLLVGERGMLKKGPSVGSGTGIHTGQVRPMKSCGNFVVSTAY